MCGEPALGNRETRGRRAFGIVPVIARSLSEGHVDEEVEVTTQSSESDSDIVQVHLESMESNCSSSSPCSLKYARR